MAKTYNPKGKRAPLTNKDMDVFPINLFFKVFYDFDKDKFDRTYTNNIKIFFDVYKNDIGFNAVHKFMNGISVAELSKLWGMSTNEINSNMNDAITTIRNNKDVVFSGFKNSKLRSKVATRLSHELIGINRFTSIALVDAGLYSASDINNIKNNSEFISMIHKVVSNSTNVGKIFSDTLVAMNHCGFDTSKFGYIGDNIGKPKSVVHANNVQHPMVNSDIRNIVGYNYNGFSTTTFKVKCPNCNKFFRIHITGSIDNDGKLKIEHTTATDSNVWYCENCMKQIRIDKVTKFLKNYLV